GMFAIITPALISGAFAERVRFGPYCLFIALWGLVVYAPLAHWVWAVDNDGNPAGWLGKMGAIEFAGGTVVHVAAGASGLAASRPPWGWPPAWWPGWSSSRRPPASSSRSAPWPWASSAAWSVTPPSASSRCSSTTTRWTPSAFTASAVSWGRC